MRKETKEIAIGGLLASLAVVILCMGTVIPMMTYAAPLLAITVLQVVRIYCSKRICWTWYAAVSLLALLLCPDREAAAVFVAFGYYPLLRPMLQKISSRFLRFTAKFLLFQLSIALVTAVVVALFGLQVLLEDATPAGYAMLAAFYVLANVCLFFADRLLGLMDSRLGRKP